MSKTKEMLIDVARQLFARDGLENTTMNDIAKASKKGRRTLYTYFKNKNEIYLAVVESELSHISDALKGVLPMNIPADDKLVRYIFLRLDAIKEAVLRNGTLRSEFFRDIWKVEQARKKFDSQEISMIQTILRQGIEEGVFNLPSVEVAALYIHYSLRGWDVPYIRGVFNELGITRYTLREYILDIVFNGIKK
ncbi:MAG: TetR/AcrR family transcriptional regulator [Bacteroidales bacterium]|nr:TetR/AcrR family transcriptional regulator [Bacteroidales bacterium]